MSKLSIYAQFHWVNYIYFSFAMIVLMACLFLASKVLNHHPFLLFLFLIITFYLLIGHGFVIKEWQVRSDGEWVTAKSSKDLLLKIKQLQLKGGNIKAVKPISLLKITKEYIGGYHYLRTRESNHVDVWYYAAPFSESINKKEFNIWVTCTSDGQYNSRGCFDDINTNTGGGYLTYSKFERNAVDIAIEKYHLNQIDEPVILKWSQNIEEEIDEHIQFNNKIIKVIIILWMVISSLRFLFPSKE